MNDELRVGVIGTGRIGRIHAYNLQQRVAAARVVAVADPFVDRARDWLDEIAVDRRYTDYRSIIDDEAVDAVFICSSTDTHAEVLAAAARGGKHAFCEKPIDLDVERVRRVLELVEESGVFLQIGFNRRFDHNFAAVERAVREGRVGDVHLIRVSSRDPEPPPAEYVKLSGGIFMDMTIHDFDMMRFLSGREVVSVSTAGAVLVDPAIGELGDIDTAVVTLTFESGAIGVIDNSRKAVYGYDQRVEVFGSNGVVRAENDFPTTVEIIDADGRHADTPQWFFLERYADAFYAEVVAFVDALRSGKPPAVGPRDGLEPMYIALAAQRSLAERRIVDMREVRG